MATLNATESWQSTSVAANDSWQCLSGPVRVSKAGSTPTNPADGHVLETLDSIVWASSGTVYYKTVSVAQGLIDTQAL